MGIVENVITIKINTGEVIALHILVLITLIALPFAVFGGLIVDRSKIV